MGDMRQIRPPERPRKADVPPGRRDPSEPSLVKRLQQRKVVEWTVAYLAGAWVVFEATGTAVEIWDISILLLRSIHVLLVIGFFVAVVLAWFHGEKGRQRIGGLEAVELTVLFLIAGAFLTWVTRPREPDYATPAGTIPADTTLASPVPQPSGESPAGSQVGIAVLPFSNYSPEAEDDWYADAFHEQITSSLAAIEGLSVRGRTSVAAYGDAPRTAPILGEELGVEFLVEGGCQIVGGQGRLTVHLIHARRDEHVWVGEYPFDLDAESLLQVQREIAERIASEVGVVVSTRD